VIELKRTDGWRKRLDDTIDAIRFVPFDWEAQHDCGPGLAGRVILSITGVDINEPYRGLYGSAAGAYRTMREAGFTNLADMAASMLPEIHPSKAEIGDIAAFPMDTKFGFALGVVNGERVFVLRPEGIGTMSLLQATRAFKVG